MSDRREQYLIAEMMDSVEVNLGRILSYCCPVERDANFC